jgi:hypothetical protein
VLRLDDDERCSDAMIKWLVDQEYRACDHWKFPRANMWTDTHHLVSAQLWPDHQTRLSTRAKSGGRRHVHDGSPYGGGRPAPVAIEHFKFVVKSQEERQKIADRYDSVRQGFGSGGMLAFSLPELVYDSMPIKRWGDGSVAD